jgi:hypothetical protein
MAAHVQERVPVRAVAGEPGDLGREDQADLAQGDARDQVLEARAVRGGRPAQAEVGVDDVDIGLTPAELAGALPQRVLQAQALLVAQHLVRGGLADVDHRTAAEVVRLDELRTHGSAPGGSRRGPR